MNAIPRISRSTTSRAKSFYRYVSLPRIILGQFPKRRDFDVVQVNTMTVHGYGLQLGHNRPLASSGYCFATRTISSQGNGNQPPRLGTRLRDTLRKLEDSPSAGEDHGNDLLAHWKHAEDVFRSSLQDLRVLRARTERGTTNNNADSKTERDALVLDCLRLLDRLAESLPREEEYSSSWLFSGYPDAASVLDKNLLNEFLREWMIGWKDQQQQQQHAQQQQQLSGMVQRRSKLLPSPPEMAETIDRYRSRCLVQPDPTSFNLLLNAMIRESNSSTNTTDRTRAVRLADTYLKRLLEAQQQPPFPNYVDIVSITTVMKGWVDLGQPVRAQDWLEMMEEQQTHNNHQETVVVEPNAFAYSIAIDGWAQRGDASMAESILNKALERVANTIAFDDNPSIYDDYDDGWEASTAPIIDRVVFHTVLDAWEARAKAISHKPKTHNNTNQHASEEPAVRAKALVRTMNDLVEQHLLRFGHLVPNDETWQKLISVVASSRGTEDAGPEAAEKLLMEHEANHGAASSSKAVVLSNRILEAYCSCGTRMEDAEAFFHRRLAMQQQQQEQLEAGSVSNVDAFPKEVSFNTILSGWARAAEVAAKRHTKKKGRGSNKASIAASEIPLRAEAWLETMEHQYGCKPSVRSYGSVLQAWSLTTKHHSDAADRAEDLLRRAVWPMLEENRSTAEDLGKGIVICTNIVLRAWSNQTAALASNSTSRAKKPNKHNGRTVRKCLRLLNDFLALVEREQHGGILLRPTEQTFRPVLHAIATPSNGMSPIQKHDHARALLNHMRDAFRLRPGGEDLSKFERLKKRRDAILKRRNPKSIDETRKA